MVVVVVLRQSLVLQLRLTGTHDIPASAFQVLGLHACIIILSFRIC
jgi:hypothetical protein